MKHTTIQDIIDAAGGYPFFEETYGLSYFAIHAWKHRGIPERYWKPLAKVTGLPIEQIKKASSKAKTQNASTK